MKAWADLRKLPRELWILCFATLVNRLGTMVLPFLVIYLTKELHFSAAQAGLALAVYGLVSLIVTPLAGQISDRFGARLVMEWGLLLSGIILLAFPLAHSWAAVLTVVILFGMVTEAFRPANMALVGTLGPTHLRRSAFALSRWSVNLGMSVGPALGGFLAQKSFLFLFVVDGVTTLAAASILFFSSFHERVAEAEAKETTSAPAGRPLGAFFTDMDLRLILLGIIPVALVFFQHESTLGLFLVRDLKFSESAYGFLFTINTVLIILLEIPLNGAMAHWPIRRTLALGSFLFAAGFGAMAFCHNFFQVALTVVVWTFGEMILFPGMSAYVSEIAPPGKQGEYMGLYMMTFGVAFMVGPWGGTLILERLGSAPLWGISFALGLVSVLVLRLAKKRGTPLN